MQLIRIIVIVLLAGAVFAQTETEFNIENLGGGSEQFLGAPRNQVFPLDDGGVVVLHMEGATYGLLRYVDYGQTSEYGPFATGVNYDHNHFLRRNDTLWICYNDNGTYSNITVGLYNIASTPMVSLTTGTIDSSAWNSYISSIAFFSNDYPDSMILVSRGAGGEYDKNIMYARSGDRGQTWAWGGDVVALNKDCRIGLRQFGDSAVLMYFVPSPGYSSGAYHLYAYAANSGWHAISSGSKPLSDSLNTRDFTFEADKSGTIHCIYSDTLTPSRVIDSWIHPESTAFVETIIHTSDKKEVNAFAVNNRSMQVAACLTLADSSLRVFFNSSCGNATSADRDVYWKTWNDATQTWGDSTVLSSPSGAVTELTGALHVPSSHGGKSYVGISQYGTGADNYLATVTWTPTEDEDCDLLISSLPYTVTAAMHSAGYSAAGPKKLDTVKIAGDKLTSVGSGIIFENTKGWYLMGAGDTLLCANGATSSSWQARGISMSQSSDSIFIDSVIILMLNTDIDTATYVAADTIPGRSWGISAGAYSNYINITRCYVEVNGYNSYGITLGRGYTCNVEHTNVKNTGPGFSNRCQFYSAGFMLDNHCASETPSGGYNVRLYDCKVLQSPHVGIYAAGRDRTGEGIPDNYGVFQIEACTLVASTKNIMFFPSAAGVCENRANAYSIQITRGGPDTYIKHCQITADEGNHGGRGIMLVGTNATEANPLVICSSYVNVHEAGDVYYRPDSVFMPNAIRIRQENIGVHVFDNQFIYVGDGSVPYGTLTGSYLPSGHGMMIEDWDGEIPRYITVENNLIRVQDKTKTGGACLSGITLDNFSSGYDTTTIVRYNRIETDDMGFRFGGYDDMGRLALFEKDTLIMIDTSLNTNEAFHVGWRTMSYQCDSIFIRDFAFYDKDGTPQNYESSVVFQGGATGNRDIRFQRTLSILVTDGDNNPLSGATVQVTDNYGHLQIDTTTNASGIATGIVDYLYYNDDFPDSTFSPFTLEAAYGGGEATNSGFTADWQVYSDTLVIGEMTPTEYKIMIKGGNIRGGVFK